MTHVASATPVAPALRCEACGYLLTGLGGSGHCPECGHPFAPGVTTRRPAPFELRPTVAALARTAAAALFRPGGFFANLSPRPAGTRAAWFARGHRFVAASLLAVAAAGHLIVHTDFKSWLYAITLPPSGVPSPDQLTINLGFTRYYWGDEPTLFQLLAPLLALLFYGVIALLTRMAARLATRFAAARGVTAHPPVILRALHFHAVHWVPVALAAAVTVGGPRSLALTPLLAAFYLLAASVTAFAASRGRNAVNPTDAPARPRFRAARLLAGAIVVLAAAAYYLPRIAEFEYEHLAIPHADPRPYHYALAIEALLFPAYLLLTGRVAVRKMMYAGEEP